MDSGPSAQRRATTCSRVGSPSAAKTGADSRSSTATALRAFDMVLEVLDLLGPAAFVLAERLAAAIRRQRVEPRFGDGEARAAGRVCERKFDERGRLGGVVLGCVHVVRVPPEGEAALRLHPLDADLDGQVLVAGKGGAAAHGGALGELTLETGPEPGAEFP